MSIIPFKKAKSRRVSDANDKRQHELGITPTTASSRKLSLDNRSTSEDHPESRPRTQTSPEGFPSRRSGLSLKKSKVRATNSLGTEFLSSNARLSRDRNKSLSGGCVREGAADGKVSGRDRSTSFPSMLNSAPETLHGSSGSQGRPAPRPTAADSFDYGHSRLAVIQSASSESMLETSQESSPHDTLHPLCASPTLGLPPLSSSLRMDCHEGGDSAGPGFRKGSISPELQLLQPCAPFTSEDLLGGRRKVAAVSEKLRQLLHEADLVQNRLSGTAMYADCFVKEQAVAFMIEQGIADHGKAGEVLRILDAFSFVCFVNDKQHLRQDQLYRFRRDDCTWPAYSMPVSQEDEAIGTLLRQAAVEKQLIHTQPEQNCSCSVPTVHTRCIVGSDLHKMVISTGHAQNSPSATEFCAILVDVGVLLPVCGNYHFIKNQSELFCFWRDMEDCGLCVENTVRLRSLGSALARKSSTDDGFSGKMDARKTRSCTSFFPSHLDARQTSSGRTTNLSSVTSQEVSISVLKDESALRSSSPDSQPDSPFVRQGSRPRSRAMSRTDDIVSTRSGLLRKQEKSLTNPLARATVEQLQHDGKADLVERTVQLMPDYNGYGFVLYGRNPVLVLTVDGNSPAEHAGVHHGDVVVSVNGDDMLTSSHSAICKTILDSPGMLEMVLLSDHVE